MIQKVFYLNDTQSTVQVFKDTLMGPPVVLGPAGHCVIEVEMPETSMVFVKNWGSYILIGHTEYEED